MTNYKKAVNVYNRTVNKLKEHVKDIPHVDFMRLWQLAERAGYKCQAAQRALHRHIAEHDC